MSTQQKVHMQTSVSIQFVFVIINTMAQQVCCHWIAMLCSVSGKYFFEVLHNCM